MAERRRLTVVVLAAGEGTRMRSATPKVLHEVGGRTMLGHVLAAVGQVTPAPAETIVVVGHGRDEVTAGLPSAARAVVQAEQRGTGHAVRVALEAAPAAIGDVLVLYGDMPLLRTETLQALLDAHAGAAATMLTTRAADPTGYGRIVRRPDSGEVTGIVEHKDATADQLTIDEINVGVYAFDADALRSALTKISTDNAQGEEYLTDVIGLLVADGHRPATVGAEESETLGVNDRVQLAEAGAVLNRRTVEALMRAGTTVQDPASTWVDVTVTADPDSVVAPYTILRGTTHLGPGARVGPWTQLTDTAVGAGARVVAATCVGAQIGDDADVGPYTYLRPGTRLGTGAKAGGFVEIKNSEVGDGSKVPHLSYVGDATIGERSNIGAATVFVNYDGQGKHRTTVGDDVRIGSDTMLVAPVTIGDAAYTAAGSVITNDVPPGALGVGRARQRNIEGWVERRRRPAPEGHEQGDAE